MRKNALKLSYFNFLSARWILRRIENHSYIQIRFCIQDSLKFRQDTFWFEYFLKISNLLITLYTWNSKRTTFLFRSVTFTNDAHVLLKEMWRSGRHAAIVIIYDARVTLHRTISLYIYISLYSKYDFWWHYAVYDIRTIPSLSCEKDASLRYFIRDSYNFFLWAFLVSKCFRGT